MCCRLDQTHRLLDTCLALSVLGVERDALLECLHSFMELLLQLVTCAFTSPGLDEVGVNLERLVSISHTAHGLHKLDVGEGAIAVNEFVVGITLGTLIELLDGGGEVAGLEQCVATLFVLLSDLGVNVGKSILYIFLFYYFFHGLLDVVVVVLQEGLAVERDGLLELALATESIGFASHSFAKLDIIVGALFGNLDHLIALLDNLVEFAHLEVDSSQVGVVGHFLRAELDGFGVEFDRVREVLLLIEAVSFELLGLGIARALQCLALLIRHGSLSGGFLSSGLLLSALFLLSFALSSNLFLFLLLLGAISSHLLEVETSELLKDLHEARVHLDGLHEHLGVHHAHIEHVLELHVLEVGSELRVRLDCLKLGLGEGAVATHARHAAHSTHTSHTSHTSHAGHATHLTHHFHGLLLLGALKELLALCVVSVLLDTSLIRGDSFIEQALSLLRHAFALVALGPIRLNTDALLRICLSLGVLLQLVVGGRAVAQDSVVGGVLAQRLCVQVHSTLEVFLLERLRSLLLEC
mmetsp:Transcript_509/g.664  ORF Transcript_509/g.664 Transcript_509/m.664 type:complete len:525 (-) Transcript_509:24-1598(-)